MVSATENALINTLETPAVAGMGLLQRVAIPHQLYGRDRCYGGRRRPCFVVAAGEHERNWHLWNDVVAYVDSGISSAHDIIERLAPRKAFEITGHTAPAPFGCSICGDRAMRRH